MNSTDRLVLGTSSPVSRSISLRSMSRETGTTYLKVARGIDRARCAPFFEFESNLKWAALLLRVDLPHHGFGHGTACQRCVVAFLSFTGEGVAGK